MACSEQVNSTQVNRDWTKARKLTAPISLEDLVENEVQLLLEERAIHDLLVLADLTNEGSTRIKQKICILDHPKT